MQYFLVWQATGSAGWKFKQFETWAELNATIQAEPPGSVFHPIVGEELPLEKVPVTVEKACLSTPTNTPTHETD